MDAKNDKFLIGVWESPWISRYLFSGWRFLRFPWCSIWETLKCLELIFPRAFLRVYPRGTERVFWSSRNKYITNILLSLPKKRSKSFSAKLLDTKYGNAVFITQSLSWMRFRPFWVPDSLTFQKPFGGILNRQKNVGCKKMPRNITRIEDFWWLDYIELNAKTQQI